MRFLLTSSVMFVCVGCLFAQEQTAAQASATRGMPARATPGDYQARAQVGPITIAAEFMKHEVQTAGRLLTTEDYVVVEAGVFGPPGTRTTLKPADFTLRINGKKPLASEPYELVFKSLKDPEWEPDIPPEQKKSATSINSGGKAGDPPPAPPKPPFKLQREWNQSMEKYAFPEGDRPLPQAGLLFFKHGGKDSGVRTLELIYSGPAGTAKLDLTP